MSQDGPSAVPTFYTEGKKTPEGRLVRRSVAIDDEDEVMPTSQSPPPMSEQKAPVPTRESAFGPEPPSSVGRGASTRWSLDDQRREEYWRGYWDRKRQEREIEKERERESQWYPEYRRPMRFIEYPEDEMEKGQARHSSGGPPRSANRKESVQGLPSALRPATRMRRRSSEAEALPSKRAEMEYGDDDNVEAMDHGGRPRTKRGGMPPGSPPRMVPRYKPSFDSASISMRLPFLSWMGNTLKSRMYYPSFPLDFSDCWTNC